MTPRSRDDLGERMAKMETDIKYIKERVDDTHSILQAEIKRTNDRFDQAKKEYDDRYASKNVERFVYGLIGSICFAVLAAIMMVVIK